MFPFRRFLYTLSLVKENKIFIQCALNGCTIISSMEAFAWVILDLEWWHMLLYWTCGWGKAITTGAISDSSRKFSFNYIWEKTWSWLRDTEDWLLTDLDCILSAYRPLEVLFSSRRSSLYAICARKKLVRRGIPECTVTHKSKLYACLVHSHSVLMVGSHTHNYF